jgi:methionine-gamma-lyase
LTADGHDWAFATQAIHGTGSVDPESFEAITPPLWLSADYLFESAEHYSDVLEERRPGYAYARFGSPTHTAFTSAIAMVEGAEDAFAFASGMAAASTCVLKFVASGGHVVVHRSIYNTTYTLFSSFLPRFGVTATFVDAEADAVAAAIRPETMLVMVDSLATPTLDVADIRGIASLCAERRIPLIIDNTIATPYLLRPLDYEGVTLSLHSTSKFIGGHSDLIGGVVSGTREIISEVAAVARQTGTIAGVFDVWLALRGLQTLAMRVERQSATAQAIAEFLDAHPAVARVGYSGLSTHSSYERARQLFHGDCRGALVAVWLVGGYEAASRLCRDVRLVRVGAGFGGVRSELRHPASTSHRFMTPQERASISVDPNLVRLAVGGEGLDDLIADLDQALERP